MIALSYHSVQIVNLPPRGLQQCVRDPGRIHRIHGLALARHLFPAFCKLQPNLASRVLIQLPAAKALAGKTARQLRQVTRGVQQPQAAPPVQLPSGGTSASPGAATLIACARQPHFSAWPDVRGGPKGLEETKQHFPEVERKSALGERTLLSAKTCQPQRSRSKREPIPLTRVAEIHPLRLCRSYLR
jgi:hypothetical protein